jgi:hypothetical protein
VRRLVVGLVGALACAGPRVTPAANELPAFALSPASCGCVLALDQRLTVFRGDATHTLDARLEVDGASVRVALLSAGQPLGRLTWDGVHLEAQVPPGWPDAVTPRRVLSDLQAVWWPEAALRSALSSPWTLEGDATSRRFRRAGAEVVSIQYEGRGPAFPKVVLEHRGRYRLDIESTESP